MKCGWSYFGQVPWRIPEDATENEIWFEDLSEVVAAAWKLSFHSIKVTQAW